MQNYEDERLSLLEMDQSGELDAEMREMVRGEQKDLVVKQLVLEAAITTMLLPSDPNDDRCVMPVNILTVLLISIFAATNCRMVYYPFFYLYHSHSGHFPFKFYCNYCTLVKKLCEFTMTVTKAQMIDVIQTNDLKCVLAIHFEYY